MFLEEKRDGESPFKSTHQSRAAFVAVLQDCSRWPQDFVWDYKRHECCAIGLARRLGHVDFPTSLAMAEAFGISSLAARHIFITGNRNWFGRSRTKPRQIARALEKAAAA